MRKITQENKLNALLGLTAKAEEVKVRSTGRIVGVTEEEIQEFREAQGLIYFLQAPALFTPKICPECEERFMVSRQYVKYCSYQCIKTSLVKIGIKWSKGKDLERLAQDPQVFDGNEPLWIRQSVLMKLEEMASLSLPNLTPSTPEPVELSPSQESSPDITLSSEMSPIPTLTTTSSSDASTMPITRSTGRGSSKRSAARRVIISPS